MTPVRVKSTILNLMVIVAATSSNLVYSQQQPKRSQPTAKTAQTSKKVASTEKQKNAEQLVTRSKTKATEPPSPFDQMFLDAWKEAGTIQAEQATDVEFVRRIYLDTIGRIPTLDEARSSLAMNLSTRKGRRQLVEKLLEHPEYPRNFAVILRNALIGRNPMGGRDVDAPAFETWLRQQILQNVAWDKMVREMLAGEGPSNENGAVNYILAWARFGGSGLADENAATALTGKTTRVFLGLQIQCTQCHDHFLNSTWKQNDFWGINAFFLGMQREELPQNDLEGNNNNRQMHYVLRDQPTTAWSMFERRNATGASIPPLYIGGIEMPDFEKKPRRNALADYIVNKDRRQLARAIVNRYWAHFMGKGFVNPVDDFGDHNETILPKILDHLADQLVAQKFDLKWLIATICTSLPYQLSSELPRGDNKHDDSTFARMSLKPMSPEQLYESILTISSADASMGTGRDADQRRISQRQQWVRQFVRNFANDEGGENSEFEGTIPQAMMMMHGSMTDQVIASFKSADSKLAIAVERSLTARQPINTLTETLYAMILTRQPSALEKREAEAGFGRLLAALTQAQQGQPEKIQDSPAYKALRMAGEDITWALLNSNEFILNH